MIRLGNRSATVAAIIRHYRGLIVRRLEGGLVLVDLAKRYFSARLHRANTGLGSSISRRHSLWNLQTLVINLDHRGDRRDHVMQNFERAKIEFHFVPGVAHAIPLAGCAKAHAMAIRSWEPQVDDLLMVCEDDAEFLVRNAELAGLISEFHKNPAIDVLALGNSTRGPLLRISRQLSLTQHTQTASCYLLKPRAALEIPSLFEFSSKMLEQHEPAHIYAPDILWVELQKRSLLFAVPNTQVVRQVPSHSDIQHKFVDYGL